MIWRAIMAVTQFGVLAMAVWAAWSGALAAPVFSTAARVAAPPPADDWRAGTLRALYEVKEYRLAMAQLWLAAANDAAPGERSAFSETAAKHARAALAQGPANGYSWLVLAWANYVSEDEAGARDALAASRRWTPYSLNLSLSRALLESRWWPDLTSGEREQLLDDLVRANRGHRAAFAEERGRDARLAALWSLALARERARRDLEQSSK
jgi:hypothetical protein